MHARDLQKKFCLQNYQPSCSNFNTQLVIVCDLMDMPSIQSSSLFAAEITVKDDRWLKCSQFPGEDLAPRKQHIEAEAKWLPFWRQELPIHLMKIVESLLKFQFNVLPRVQLTSNTIEISIQLVAKGPVNKKHPENIDFCCAV